MDVEILKWLVPVLISTGSTILALRQGQTSRAQLALSARQADLQVATARIQELQAQEVSCAQTVALLRARVQELEDRVQYLVERLRKEESRRGQ